MTKYRRDGMKASARSYEVIFVGALADRIIVRKGKTPFNSRGVGDSMQIEVT
jgi:hypothetical protein